MPETLWIQPRRSGPGGIQMMHEIKAAKGDPGETPAGARGGNLGAPKMENRKRLNPLPELVPTFGAAPGQVS